MSTLRIETPQAFLPLLQPARYKGAKGGRGSGKSWFFADYLLEQCLMTPGTRAVCIREIQKDLRDSSKQLIEDRINTHGLTKEFAVMRDEIITPGNGTIIFRGMQNFNADSIKSLHGFRLAWAEEAQRLSNKSIALLLPTMFRVPDSEIWFSWNPTEPKDPVEQLLVGDNKIDGSIVVHANYPENPWFPDDLRRLMEWDRARDPEKYSHIWLGEYQKMSQARVFHNWKVEPFDTPDDARFYYGADWGFAIDPTVLIRCWIRGRVLYVDYEAWQVGCEIDKTPALFDKVPAARRWPITADSSNPQSISYMAKHGFPHIKPSVKGAGSVEEGIEFLKSYDIIVHPRCVNVIDELSTYSYEVDDKTNEVLPKLADKKNHTVDSLRYAVEGIRRANPPAATTTYGYHTR